MSAGDTYENKILDATLGDNRAPNMPATVYIDLFTTATTDAGGGAVVVGSNYAPVAVANTSVNWPAAAGGQKSNGTAITFPTPVSSYPAPVTHFAIRDAVGGAFVFHGALQAPVSVLSGQPFVFPAGTLVVGAD